MEEVGSEELLEVLHSVQKEKSPDPNGIPVEFFWDAWSSWKKIREGL
jgi:hypothetical protein